MKMTSLPPHPLGRCALTRVPSRQGLPAAEQPPFREGQREWEDLVLAPDPHAHKFKVVTVRLDTETQALLQKKIASDLAARISGGPLDSWALRIAEQEQQDLSRADQVAYEVPLEQPPARGLEKLKNLFKPERQPECWLLIGGQPIVDRELAEQNLPARSTLAR